MWSAAHCGQQTTVLSRWRINVRWLEAFSKCIIEEGAAVTEMVLTFEEKDQEEEVVCNGGGHRILLRQ